MPCLLADKQPRSARVGLRRKLVDLVCGLMLICLGACGGELEPTTGPVAPMPDGNPGQPQDDAGVEDGGKDGEASDTSTPSR